MRAISQYRPAVKLIVLCHLDLQNFFIGEKYLIKINGVWSVCRGRRLRKENIIIVKYGPDKHLWKLTGSDWDFIQNTWSKERIEREVVERNICELKGKKYKKYATSFAEFIHNENYHHTFTEDE